MKKITLSLFLVFTCVSIASAQLLDTKTAIGFQFSPFGDQSFSNSESLIGGPSYDMNAGFQLGINFTRAISKHLELEYGAELNHFKVVRSIDPGLTTGQMEEEIVTKESCNSILVPVTLKANIINLAYVRAGAFLSTGEESSYMNANGLGARFGFGFRYKMNKTEFLIGPSFDYYGIIPFNNDMNNNFTNSSLNLGFKLSL